jgi:hypothetical protein
MLEWLRASFSSGQEVALDVLAMRLGLAFFLGLAVAGIYWLTHRRDESLVPSFLSTLVLLAILIAVVTQVIGDNVARAFSLVGALSIVRFRTVVEDTRDTAFVIFAVVVGMAAGAGHPLVALVGLGITGIAAAATRPARVPHPSAASYWRVSVRVGVGTPADGVVLEMLQVQAEEVQLLSAGTARQGAALELTYKVRLRPNVSAALLVSDLNRREGVQNVDLRRL